MRAGQPHGDGRQRRAEDDGREDHLAQVVQRVLGGTARTSPPATSPTRSTETPSPWCPSRSSAPPASGWRTSGRRSRPPCPGAWPSRRRSGCATISATISAMKPSWKVTGRRAASSSATGVFCHSERPKSPCSRMPPTQRAVLLPHRLVEAERGDQLIAAELVGGDVVLAEHQVDDAARNEAHRHEHDEAREEQRRDQRQQAAHDVGLHVLGPLAGRRSSPWSAPADNENGRRAIVVRQSDRASGFFTPLRSRRRD